MHLRRNLALAFGLALSVAILGCDSKPEAKKVEVVPGSAKAAHDHSGWWCDEHGLPEEVCDLCQKKYRDAEKAKGNWCEHDRVKSSCFKCNPKLQEKYAKEYEARYGKKPPVPEPEGK